MNDYVVHFFDAINHNKHTRMPIWNADRIAKYQPLRPTWRTSSLASPTG